MSKLPFFQFYPGDWMKDTRCLSLEARGAWIDLLCLLWESPTRGQVTWPLQAFDQYLGTVDRGEVIYSAWDIIEELQNLRIADIVTESNGQITVSCRRMIREETQRKQGLERQRRFRNSEDNASVTEKSRPIYQKSEVRSHIKENKKTPPAVSFVPPDWIPKDIWEDFCTHRKSIRAPVTPLAAERIVEQLDRLRGRGFDPSFVLNKSIANGWRGVFEPKGNEAVKPPTRPTFQPKKEDKPMSAEERESVKALLKGLVAVK